MFKDVESNLGAKMCKMIKKPLCDAMLTQKVNNVFLVPCKQTQFRWLLRQESLDEFNAKWNQRGKKRLSPINAISNVVFTKAKHNPGLGVPEN